MYNLTPIPCSVLQASYYIAFLGLYMKYSSVLTYYHADVFAHRLWGIVAPPISHPLLKSVFLGILNTPQGISVPKDPMRPADIHKIYSVVDFSSEVEILVWVALLTMYRALLRVSHIVISDHSLRRGDVDFVDWGMIIWIRSAKTYVLNTKVSPSQLSEALIRRSARLIGSVYCSKSFRVLGSRYCFPRTNAPFWLILHSRGFSKSFASLLTSLVILLLIR